MKHAMWSTYHNSDWMKENWLIILDLYTLVLNDEYKGQIRQISVMGSPEDEAGNKILPEDFYY